MAAGLSLNPIWIQPVDFSMRLCHMDANEVLEIIKNLKSGASGMDSIKAYIIQHDAPIIAHPLATLINSCFSTGCFPPALKEALVSLAYTVES